MPLVAGNEINRRAVAVSAILGLALLTVLVTWLNGDPGDVPCAGDRTAAMQGFFDRAVVVHFVAAVGLMGVIGWFSAARSADGRPGGGTMAALALVFVYAVACLIEYDTFGVAGLITIFSTVYVFGPAICILAIAVAVRRSAMDTATAILAWSMLLLLLPAHMTAAWIASSAPPIC